MKFKVGDKVRIVGPSNVGYAKGWKLGAVGTVVGVYDVMGVNSPYGVRCGIILYCPESSIEHFPAQLDLFEVRS